jgi:tetratricopeptide (TPR) repeat protein
VLAEPKLDVDNAPRLRMLRAWIAMRDNRPRDSESDAMAVWRQTDISNVQDVETFMRNLLLVYSRPGDTAPRITEAEKLIREQLMKIQTGDVVDFELALMQMSDKSRREATFKELERLVREGKTPVVVMSSAKMVGNEAYSKRDYPRAIDFFQLGLKAVPDDAELLNNTGYAIAKHLNKPEEGLKLIEQAEKLVPNNANVLDSKGAVLLMMNKPDEAEAILLKARDVSSTDFERAAPTIHLIEVKLAKNDRAGADALRRDLQTLINNELAPKRIEDAYREDIDRVMK